MRLGMAIRELHQAEAAVMVDQAAKAARDRELLATAGECMEQTSVQVKWLKTRINEAAPQTLTVG